MKKLIEISVVVLLLCAAFVLPRVFADPGDVIIEIIIPGPEVAEFRLDFLRECPNNKTIPDVSDPNIMVPKYTDKQWFKHKLVAYGNKLRRRGQVKRASDAAIRKDSMQ